MRIETQPADQKDAEYIGEEVFPLAGAGGDPILAEFFERNEDEDADGACEEAQGAEREFFPAEGVVRTPGEGAHEEKVADFVDLIRGIDAIEPQREAADVREVDDASQKREKEGKREPAGHEAG